MTPRRRRAQAGYTLIELIVASSIGLIVMSALTSVVLTTVLGANTATSRIEASAQIRNFQLTAYDDFALSRPPTTSGCGTKANPCTSQSMVLSGDRMPNLVGAKAAPFTATYSYDPSRRQVTRQVSAGSRIAASDVTAYTWYVSATGGNPVVVVSMTVTAGFYDTQFSQSQTLLFYPRVTSP